jgi:hypothetical protein
MLPHQHDPCLNRPTVTKQISSILLPGLVANGNFHPFPGIHSAVPDDGFVQFADIKAQF